MSINEVNQKEVNLYRISKLLEEYSKKDLKDSDVLKLEQEIKAIQLNGKLWEGIEELEKPPNPKSYLEGLKKIEGAYRTGYMVDQDTEKEVIFNKGALTYISAPTKQGKTTILLNFFLTIAKQYTNQTHYFITYEESHYALITKMISILARVEVSRRNDKTITSYFKNKQDTNYFKNKDDKGSNILKIDNAYDEFFNIKNIRVIYAYDNHSELLDRLGVKDDTGCIFIDYLQLLETEAVNNARHLEIKELCNGLKNKAVQYNQSIIIATQYNRYTDNPDELEINKLAEGSDIEKSANQVYAIWHFHSKKTAKYEGKKSHKYKKISEYYEGLHYPPKADSHILLKLLISRDSDTWEGIFKCNYNIRTIDKEGITPVEAIDNGDRDKKNSNNGDTDFYTKNNNNPFILD